MLEFQIKEQIREYQHLGSEVPITVFQTNWTVLKARIPQQSQENVKAATRQKGFYKQKKIYQAAPKDTPSFLPN